LLLKGSGQVEKGIADMYDNAHLAPEGKRKRQSDVTRDAVSEYLSSYISIFKKSKLVFH